tara:strand:- start:478 stop:702 length:225 start_codon:yes stop_codon:yes gene_type:complete
MKTDINTIILVVIIALLLKNSCVAIKEGFSTNVMTGCVNKDDYDRRLGDCSVNCVNAKYGSTIGKMCQKYCNCD